MNKLFYLGSLELDLSFCHHKAISLFQIPTSASSSAMQQQGARHSRISSRPRARPRSACSSEIAMESSQTARTVSGRSTLIISLLIYFDKILEKSHLKMSLKNYIVGYICVKTAGFVWILISNISLI